MSLRLERGGAGRAVAHMRDGLAGQAVHEVYVEVANPGLAQPAGGALDQREGLDAADVPLHLFGRVLHAEAGAGDTDRFERRDQRRVDAARVELDRVLLQT